MTTLTVRPEASATITVTEPVVIVPAKNVTEYSYGFEDYATATVPAQTIFSTGFESGLGDGVSGGEGVTTQRAHSGTQSVHASYYLTLSGLEVGKVYTVAGWFWTDVPQSAVVGLTEDFEGNTTYETVPAGRWVYVAHTFTASAPELAAAWGVSDSPEAWWDDVTVTRNAYPTVTNDGRDGWSNGSVVSTVKRGGTYSLNANAPARAFTGLVVGHFYSLSAWHSTGAGWTSYVETFQAVATSMAKTLNVTGTRYWDDVQLIHHVPAVTTLTPTLPISQGKVRLDENYSPYVTANFQVPLTSLDLLEQIDPRDPQRVTVKASSSGHNDRVYSAWTEKRRNLAGNPTPASTTGWSSPASSGAATGTAAVTADGFTVTHATNTTPYIFSTASTAGAVAGHVYAFRAKIKAKPSAGSSFTSVNVRPHKNTANVYYNLPTPISVAADGVEREVAFYWTATADIPAGEAFNLSIVGNGGGLAGSVYSMRDVLIEDVGTVVPSTPPAEYFAPATSGELQQTRFTGTANASASVLETRAITGSVWVPEDERTFNLGLRSRTVDHGAGTVDIELASDEILLHDRKHVATTADSTARQYETSLRAVCSWALGKVGATLAPGTADADMTAAWDATNLQTNPTAGQNTTGWVGSGGTVTRINTGTWPEGTGIGSAVRVTMTAGATGGPYFEGGDSASVAGGSLNVSIREKQLYRVTAWVRTSVSKSIRLSVQQRNSAGALAGTNRSGPAFTTTANTWHRLTFVVQAYPGASRMGVYAYLASGTYAAGQTVDITGVQITEGTLDHTYFDGGTNVRPDLYAYSWNDAAHLSTSERRAHVVRRPELFDWTPGQSLFDFLQPLINASGLRLFCDETRTWRLVDPAEYEVPGYVVAQTGHNATEGTDSITRNDDTWADAVVVKYVWTDANGETKSQYDIAGDPNGKTITREIEREYPGPGAAAAILASYEGRGRTQSVTVVGQYLATPGMDVTVNLPGTLTQTGKVRAVELDLGSGLNRIETRGLTDALAGSWILWDPDQTWAEVDPGLLWKDA